MRSTALDQIAAGGLPASPGAPAGQQASAGLSLEVMAGIGVQLGRMAGIMQARADYERRCQEAIRSVPFTCPAVTVAGGAALIASAELLGPKTGYNWAVSRISCAGLASADVVSIYRGPATAAAVVPNNFQNILTGTSPAWHPGRTGFIMNPGDSIVISGTGLTATSLTITGETIIMESWLLPEFLL